ncbi:MAG: dephospho-CoA kinase [Betaproteobacteria bacterium]|nr:MAG: dephospho-CoA kinase [Betaproteobacteria bacterium]
MSESTAVLATPFLVGLTGGIGSGKTSAADILGARGAFVVDVDQISRELTAMGGDAVSAIAQAFPSVVHDGIIDRTLLRQIVFADTTKRQALESILHPLIGIETSKLIESNEAHAASYVLLVVPLLFESDRYAERIDCAVVIDVDEIDQIARVTASRNIDESSVAKIISAQLPREARLRRAQFVIDNRGDRKALERQLVELHSVLCANARQSRELRVSAQPKSQSTEAMS